MTQSQMSPIPGAPGATAGVPGSPAGVAVGGASVKTPPTASVKPPKLQAPAVGRSPVSQPKLGVPMADMLGQFAGSGFKNQMPTMLSAVLGVPQLRNAATGIFRAGGAPLLFGLSDIGNNFKNIRTLTQGSKPLG